MSLLDTAENIKANIEKYGFFFWFILFGLIEIIVSIIYNEEFIYMGFYFCAYGLVGYALSELTDRISGKMSVVKYWWIFFYKITLSGLLLFLINRKFPLL